MYDPSFLDEFSLANRYAVEEEIDLRPYFEAIIKGWYWILALGVLAAIVTFAVSSLIQPTYEATALVVIAEPRQRVQFDPRIETVNETQPLGAYPELATSDEVLGKLLAHVTLPDVEHIVQLRNMLEAEHGSDDSLLRLTVRYHDPAQAAEVANQWAWEFVSWGNDVYGFQGADQLEFFIDQMDTASTDLTVAEEALTAFQGENRTVILQNSLTTLELTQASLLKSKEEFVSLRQDIEAMRQLLEATRNNDTSIAASQLTLLFLELKAFNISPADGASPIQIQTDFSGIESEVTRDGQLTHLSALSEVVQDRLSEVDALLLELEPRILLLQQEKQAMEAAYANLLRNYSIAEETYVTLARKVDEERITSQDMTDGIRVASETVTPRRPVEPRRTLYTISLGVMGMMLASFGLLVQQWHRSNS